MLAIESPGGSATQSDLIGQLIRRRHEDASKVKVTAVIGDVGASGGYWLACAADEIRANRLSIVGSIGVITGGFGLDKFIARYGIERRLQTAGENKARNEMFSPQRAEDVTCSPRNCWTKPTPCSNPGSASGAAPASTSDENAIFDGGYMLGEKAKTLGLIDGFGDVDHELVKELGRRQSQTSLASRQTAPRPNAPNLPHRSRSRPGNSRRAADHPKP